MSRWMSARVVRTRYKHGTQVVMERRLADAFRRLELRFGRDHHVMLFQAAVTRIRFLGQGMLMR